MTAEQALDIVNKWTIPKDKTVYIFEMPGVGHNNRAHNSRFRGTNLAEGSQWLSNAVGALKLTRFDIYGYGYGAGITLHYFSMNDKATAIRRAVFINPVVFETISNDFRDSWCQTPNCESPIFAWYDEASYHVTNQWKSLGKPWFSAFTRNEVSARRNAGIKRYWEQITRHVFYSKMPLNPRRCKRHSSPDLKALFLFGKINRIVDPEKAATLDRVLEWPDKHFEVVEDAGHFGARGSFFALNSPTVFDLTSDRTSQFIFGDKTLE